jgi:general secretion pathway protein J
MRCGSASKATGFNPATRHGRAAFSRSGGSAAKATGFTLIEVLLATTLLAAGLALAFATLRAATATATRGEAIAQRSERMRAVEGFLRRRLGATQPIAYALDQDTGLASRFNGDEQHMRFVADLPDYLGRGGPYLHDLAVERDGDGVRLTLALQMVLAGQAIEETRPRPPEILADGLRAVRFRYRALDADNQLGEWQDKWETGEALPLQVEISLRDAAGRDWPPLLVALPLAGSYGATAMGTQQ